MEHFPFIHLSTLTLKTNKQKTTGGKEGANAWNFEKHVNSKDCYAPCVEGSSPVMITHLVLALPVSPRPLVVFRLEHEMSENAANAINLE